MDTAKPAVPKAGAAKQPWMEANVIMHNLLLIESHYRKVGRPILDAEVDISEAAKALWEAPFAVLAHDRSDPEPVFVYGNAAAQQLFECSWEELVGTPSRQSAEPKDEIQEDRSRALAAAAEKGVIDDYEGWRVSFKGTRFQIRRATLFNVEAPSGDVKGQAVVIREWEFEDGTKGGEGVAAPAAAGQAPSPEELQQAELAVEEQAAAVRALKEGGGKTNADVEVQAAVAELLARKEALAGMQQRTAAAAAAEGGPGGQSAEDGSSQ